MPDSFEREALPHLDAVYRFALRLTRSTSDADDLVQETFLRGYRSWHRYQPGTQAKSWLFTICRNAFLRTRAREARRGELVRRARGPVGANGAPESVLASATPAVRPDGVIGTPILRRIDALPPEFRAAVRLCDLHGTPYAEAARLLGVPLGTLKSRLHRGRRLLQQQLAEAAEDIGIAPLRKEA